MNSLKILLLAFIAILFVVFQTSAQLLINPNGAITPAQAVQNVLLGAGVNAFNITYNGSAPNALNVQASVQEFDAGATAFPLANGVHLTTQGAPLIADPDLAIIAGAVTNGVVIEFDFIPSGASINFNYIFASAEYANYTCSNFNDGFGFFISGPGIAGPFTNNAINIATVPNTTVPVAINTVNGGVPTGGGLASTCAAADPNWQANSIYFTTAYNSIYSATPGVTNYNGSTVPLEAQVNVICDSVYHIKLAICNVVDQSLNSGVFLEGGSFSSPEVGISSELFDISGNPLNSDTLYQGCNSAEIYLIKPPGYIDSTYNITVNLGGTAIPGTHFNDISGSYTINPGQDSLALSINPIGGVPLPGGVVTVIISGEIINECGDIVQTNDTIYIAEPPLFSVIVSDTTITCPNTTPQVTLGYTTSGGEAPFTQVWSPGGQTSPTINAPTTTAGTITYTVDVTDACGVTISEDIEVTVIEPLPLDITFNANTFTLCPNDQVNPEVTNVTNAQGPLTYEWTDESGTVTSTSAATTASPTPSQFESWYYVEVSDGCLTAIDSIKLELGGVDVTNVTVTPSSDCVGATANNGEIVITTNPPTGMTYTLVGAGNSFGPQGSGTFSNLIGGVNYTYTVTDPFGCQTSNVVNVGLLVGQPNFDTPLSNIQNISCFGADDGAATVININGGASPSPPYELVWQNSNGNFFSVAGFNTEGQNHTENTLEGGTWTVTVFDDNGCAFSETFNITEPAELAIDLVSLGEPSCYNGNDGSINISTAGGVSGKVWTWTNTSTGDVVQTGNTQQLTNAPTGEYTVTVEDANGCSNSETYFLDHPDSIQFYINIDSVICFGDSTGAIIIDSVNVNNLSDYSYTLNPGGIQFDTAFSFIELPSGTYTLSVTDNSGNGCTIPSITLVVNDPPPFQWTLLESEPSLCFPGSNGDGQVSVSVTGGWNGNYTIVWTDTVNNNFSTNPTWGNRPAGTYFVRVTEENTECRWDTSLVVESIDPIAIIDVNPTNGVAPIDVTAENNSQNAVEYIWYANGNFVTLTNDIEFGIDTTFTTGDTVEYCLVAINETGCIDTACQIVEIIPPLSSIEPNVFTPDGDGVNDVFFFPMEGVRTFECVIFDRWGKKVYEWSDYTQGWDGRRSNGNEVPDGVYFYMMEATGLDGTSIQKQGNIHLKRKT